MNGIINLPTDYSSYIDRIHKRCDRLIRSHIWSGLDRNDLSSWCKSFKTNEEKYFSAFILDNLVFRSDAQTRALMIQAIQRNLPELLSRNSYYDKYRGKWTDTIQKSQVPVRLVPVIRNGDGPHKSGHIVAREYIRQAKVNSKLIINPDEINSAKANGAKLFIFIDDFLGTGKQFSRFYKDYKSEFNNFFNAIYIPLCAHQVGLSKVQKTFPELGISTPELLTDENSLFSNNTTGFDELNSKEAFREFYLELAKKRLGDTFKDIEGYGNLGLTYGFNHATPNATIPLLWANGNKNNKILLKRA